MKPTTFHPLPARKWLVSCTTAAVVLVAFFLVVLLSLPSCAPTWAWKSRWVVLQEPAIPHLMNRLHVGMTYEELVEVMGRPSNPVRDSIHSYNVNSWYNSGIDVTVSNGVVVSIFRYD